MANTLKFFYYYLLLTLKRIVSGAIYIKLLPIGWANVYKIYKKSVLRSILIKGIDYLAIKVYNLILKSAREIKIINYLKLNLVNIEGESTKLDLWVDRTEVATGKKCPNKSVEVSARVFVYVSRYF